MLPTSRASLTLRLRYQWPSLSRRFWLVRTLADAQFSIPLKSQEDRGKRRGKDFRLPKSSKTTFFYGLDEPHRHTLFRRKLTELHKQHGPLPKLRFEKLIPFGQHLKSEPHLLSLLDSVCGLSQGCVVLSNLFLRPVGKIAATAYRLLFSAMVIYCQKYTEHEEELEAQKEILTEWKSSSFRSK